MTVKHGFQGDKAYISTSKGRRFYLSAPVFDIEEIAHSTSLMCRFNGHCRQFYSVAEHSLLVALICEQLGLADPFEGLMHDAHEAYLVDLAKPWKVEVPGFELVEKRLELAMRKHYQLTDEITAGCKRADWIALAIEARALLPSRGTDFAWPEGVLADAARLSDIRVNCQLPGVSRQYFLHTFAELSAGRGL